MIPFYLNGGGSKLEGKLNIAFRVLHEYWPQDHHSHDLFEIYYFHSGNSKFLIGDSVYELQPNDMIIMNGLTLHRPHPLPNVPYERSVLEFSQEWIRPILKSLNLPELLVPFLKLNNFLFRNVDKEVLLVIRELLHEISLLDKQIEQLPEVEKNQSLHFRLLNGRISTLFIQLLFKIYEISRAKIDLLPPNESEKDYNVERVVTWIQQNFDQNISLDTIAESVNISKYHMCRIFKEITGLTVMQYLMSCRINRAKYLLEMSDKNITEVALSTGFENSSHFSRFFREQVKVTPKEYRKQKRKVLNESI